MKIVDKAKNMVKVSYEFIKTVPTDTKAGVVVNFVSGATIGEGVITALTGDPIKGIAKTIGGVGLGIIGSTLINNGIDKMYDEKYIKNFGAWINVDDDQIADSIDITNVIDNGQI